MLPTAFSRADNSLFNFLLNMFTEAIGQKNHLTFLFMMENHPHYFERCKRAVVEHCSVVAINTMLNRFPEINTKEIIEMVKFFRKNDITFLTEVEEDMDDLLDWQREDMREFISMVITNKNKIKEVKENGRFKIV